MCVDISFLSQLLNLQICRTLLRGQRMKRARPPDWDTGFARKGPPHLPPPRPAPVPQACARVLARAASSHRDLQDSILEPSVKWESVIPWNP